MGRTLHVLLVEDSEDDATLLLRELRRGGFAPKFERVDTGPALERALVTGAWDIVLSDYSMPRFSAPDALEIVKASGTELPFIIVSGTVGEDTAVAALKAGANDFILKDHLARLVPAVERELREAAVRAERRKMQQQLVLSDRMVSVGTLAAGVAHEINNPLAAVLANLEFAEGELDRIVQADSTAHGGLTDVIEPIRDARAAAERVRQIVRDLKLFSRPDEERRGALDVHRVLDSTLRMAENEIRHRATLVKDYGVVPLVDGNEARLGQVFLNLVINAAQAIPEGSAQKDEIRVVTRTDENGRALIEVHDTGSGISPALVKHLFEPFFTTKPVGVGMGLGLAICHRIVSGMGGEIAVQSEVGHGTVFRVFFPACSSTISDTDAPPAGLRAVGRRAKVLAVDDEAMVGMAISRILGSQHDVTALTDPRAALDRLSRGERFDVILCNVMMPVTTGAELHAQVELLAPEQAQRMVFMTGGAFTPAARTFLDQVGNRRVDKPFDAPRLRDLVASFVENSPA